MTACKFSTSFNLVSWKIVIVCGVCCCCCCSPELAGKSLPLASLACSIISIATADKRQRRPIEPLLLLFFFFIPPFPLPLILPLCRLTSVRHSPHQLEKAHWMSSEIINNEPWNDITSLALSAASAVAANITRALKYSQLQRQMQRRAIKKWTAAAATDLLREFGCAFVA